MGCALTQTIFWPRYQSPISFPTTEAVILYDGILSFPALNIIVEDERKVPKSDCKLTNDFNLVKFV
jgi:hypothetical protein